MHTLKKHRYISKVLFSVFLLAFLPIESKGMNLTELAENNDIEQLKRIVSGKSQGEIENLLSKKNQHNDTPFHTAAFHGKINFLNCLLGLHPQGINLSGNRSFTPLHTAASRGNLEVVKFLHENGARMDAIDDGERTALHVAQYRGFIPVYGYPSYELTSPPLHNLDQKDKFFDTIEYLSNITEHLSNRTKINLVEISAKDIGTPLHFAARYGLVNQLEALTQRKDINLNCSPIIRKGSYPEKIFYCYTPLHMAMLYSQEEAMKFLQRKGALWNVWGQYDIWDQYKQSTFHAAIFHGHTDFLRKLIGFFPEGIDSSGPNGTRPLHKAASIGNLEAVKLLHEKGARMDVQDILVILQHIRYVTIDDAKKYNKIIEYYVEKNPELFKVSASYSGTPLHVAARQGLTEQLKIILNSRTKAKGVNVDCKDANANTPLYVAIDNGQIAAANYLMEQGAKLETQIGEFGGTILHCAASKGGTFLKNLWSCCQKQSCLSYAATNKIDNYNKRFIDLLRLDSNDDWKAFSRSLPMDNNKCLTKDNCRVTLFFTNSQSSCFGYNFPMPHANIAFEYLNVNEADLIEVKTMEHTGVPHPQTRKHTLKIQGGQTAKDYCRSNLYPPTLENPGRYASFSWFISKEKGEKVWKEFSSKEVGFSWLPERSNSSSEERQYEHCTTLALEILRKCAIKLPKFRAYRGIGVEVFPWEIIEDFNAKVFEEN